MRNAPDIISLIGNTPLVRLTRLPGVANLDRGNVILGKLEGNNPAGSVKDRPAISMIMRAQERGQIKPGTFGAEAQGILRRVRGGIHCGLPGQPPRREGQVEGRQGKRAILQAHIRLQAGPWQVAEGYAAQGKLYLGIQGHQQRHGQGDIGNNPAIAGRRRA